MKIYDCFTFYNEFELLELRLKELYDSVDYFVIVESDHTFTNRKKEWLFDKNREKYSKWSDKIIHIKFESNLHDDPWLNEADQRNAIMLGCKDATAEDIIIVSDCDEILRPKAVDHMRKSINAMFGFRMPLFNFKFNYMRTTPNQYDIWAMAARKELLDE